MSTTSTLIKRNIKLFFKDKGMFFYSAHYASNLTRTLRYIPR